MKRANRKNRSERQMMQGYGKNAHGTELNNHDPRVGIAKWGRHRKCHCKALCHGHNKVVARLKVEEKEFRTGSDFA